MLLLPAALSVAVVVQFGLEQRESNRQALYCDLVLSDASGVHRVLGLFQVEALLDESSSCA